MTAQPASGAGVGEGVPLRLCEREALPEALAERREVALGGGERVLLALPARLPLPWALPLLVPERLGGALPAGERLPVAL